jgi:hypothetical protein
MEAGHFYGKHSLSRSKTGNSAKTSTAVGAATRRRADDPSTEPSPAVDNVVHCTGNQEGSVGSQPLLHQHFIHEFAVEAHGLGLVAELRVALSLVEGLGAGIVLVHAEFDNVNAL